MKIVALVVTCLAMAGTGYSQEKPRVYITDSNSWEVRGAAGGSNGSFAASSAGGARPQTAEVIKTFSQRCPQVTINNRAEVSDYVVELDHEGGKGLLRHKDKIAVFVRTSGDSIFSASTLSVGGSVQDACGAITKHWTDHSDELKSTPIASPPIVIAQSAQGVPALLEKATVGVSSIPSGADIEVDGSFVGSTPSTLQLDLGEHEIAIKRKGFQIWTRKIKVTGGNLNISADLDADIVPSKPTKIAQNKNGIPKDAILIWHRARLTATACRFPVRSWPLRVG